mgnify:CR=1 FL=1
MGNGSGLKTEVKKMMGNMSDELIIMEFQVAQEDSLYLMGTNMRVNGRMEKEMVEEHIRIMTVTSI